MQSYVKAAALASVAITLHGCSDKKEEKEEKPMIRSMKDAEAFLDKSVANGEQYVQDQVKEVLKNVKFNALAGETIAAALHAAPDDKQVHEIVGQAKRGLNDAGENADHVVASSVKELHRLIDSLDLQNADAKAKQLLNSALTDGKKMVDTQLKSSQKSIETVAGSIEKSIKDNLNVEFHAAPAIQNGFKMLNEIISQVKDTDKVNKAIDSGFMSITQNVGGSPLNGIDIDAAEKKINKAIKDGISTVTNGLTKVEKKARIINAEKNNVLKTHNVVKK